MQAAMAGEAMVAVGAMAAAIEQEVGACKSFNRRGISPGLSDAGTKACLSRESGIEHFRSWSVRSETLLATL